MDTKVIKKAKKKIVVKGTGTLSAPTGGKTYQGSGSAVANYALQFVGNPYVYGGSSLTNGADCSGFVLAVYSHFGITMAHDAGAMRSYGREVSLAPGAAGRLGMLLWPCGNLYRRRTGCSRCQRGHGHCCNQHRVHRPGYYSQTHSRIIYMKKGRSCLPSFFVGRSNEKEAANGRPPTRIALFNQAG